MRRVQPLLWLVMGVGAVAASLLLVVQALGELVRPSELAGVPACTGAASQDCLARGPATVQRETRSRFRWLSGERRWSLDVSAVAPQVRDDDAPRVTVPEQPGQDQLQEGMKLTVVYHRSHPVLLELSSGTVLETDEHPRRFAPTTGYLGIGLLGLGAFAVLVGWRNGRRRGWWRRVDYEQPSRGGLVSAVMFFAGMAGVVAQSVAGSSRWPAAIVVLVVAGALGSLLLLSKRRRRVAS